MLKSDDSAVGDPFDVKTVDPAGGTEEAPYQHDITGLASGRYKVKVAAVNMHGSVGDYTAASALVVTGT